MAAYGLYTHIQSNRIRSVLLLIGLFFLVLVLTYAGALTAEAWLNDAPLDWYLRRAWRDTVMASPFVAIGTAIWLFIAWNFHQSMIDAITGGHEVTRQDEPRLYNLLENLCISRGTPMPTLRIIDSPALNAFATGLNQKQYSITVTTGLLKHLDDAEMEAVLGHELTHIRNGDVRLLVIAGVIAGVISFFGELMFRVMFNSGTSYRSNSDRKGNAGLAMLIAIGLLVIAWILSVVIRFALSRSREYLADAGSVELTKNPDAMISALRKIENRGELKRANSAIMEMCVDNPRSGFADLFATHPSIDSRIKALTDFAGGHDPGPLAIADDEEKAPQPMDAAGPPDARTATDTHSGSSGPWGSAPEYPANGPGESAIGGSEDGPWGPHTGGRGPAQP